MNDQTNDRPPRATDAIVYEMAGNIGALLENAKSAEKSREYLREDIQTLTATVGTLAHSVSQIAAGLQVQNGVTTEINSTLDDIEPRVEKLEKIEKDRFKRQVTVNGIMLGAGIGIGKAAEGWEYLKGLLQIGGKG